MSHSSGTRSLRVYVATKWENRERAREVMSDLRLAGHTITYDWTREEQETSEQAKADIDGVIAADVLVVIVEEDLNYRGTLVELGAALGLGKPVFLIGGGIDDKTLFTKHPLIRYTVAGWGLLDDLEDVPTSVR